MSAQSHHEKPPMTSFQKLILAFGLLAFLGMLACTCVPPKSRLKLYLGQDKIIQFYQPNRDALGPENAQHHLGEAIDKRIEYYHKLLAQLDVNRYLVAVVGGLSILLVITGKIKIPWVDAEVPRVVALRVLPLLCLFFWMDFGYNLNSCIDARLVSMQLINADLARSGYTEDRPDFQKAHYTVTRSAELEDHGLVDAWFLNFMESPQTFVVAKRDRYNWLIPIIGIVWYAAVYGLVHAAAFFLPTRDLIGHSDRPTAYAWVILCLSVVVISFTHLSFYCAGMHWNWFQAATLGFSLLIYILFCRRFPRTKSTSTKGSA